MVRPRHPVIQLPELRASEHELVALYEVGATLCRSKMIENDHRYRVEASLRQGQPFNATSRR